MIEELMISMKQVVIMQGGAMKPLRMATLEPTNIAYAVRKEVEVEVDIVNEIPEEDLLFITSVINNDELGALDSLGHGSYGRVYGYKEYAIKKIHRFTGRDLYLRHDSDFQVADAQILKKLQGIDCIPILYAVIDKSYLVTNRVRGLTVRDFEINMDSCDEMDNYISSSFNDKFEEALIQIVSSGYIPYDLHKSNVMIDSITGMPVIVDVGLFEKHDEDITLTRDSLSTHYMTNIAMSYISDTLSSHVKAKRSLESESFDNILES